jgi:hypothetical protein
MKHRLKIIIALLILIGYLLLTERLLFKDVIFIFLVILIPGFAFSNIEYLFKRSQIYLKFMENKLFTNLIITIFVFTVIVFVTRNKYIPKDSVLTDLKFMINTLENVHPDIYHIVSKDSFSIKLNEEIDNLPERVTELEFFLICARLTSHFRTGHTRPRENLILTHFILGRAFPFETKIIDDRLFVINNLSLFSSVPVGSEITEINSKSINQVMTEWSKLVSYENIAYRNNLITRPINIGIWNNFKNFTIKYNDQNTGEIKEKVVNGGIASNMYSNLKSRVLKPQNFIYRELTPEIGYIGFFSCMDLKNYQEFYTSTFNTLKNNGIQHLIIDTRDNGGGHSIIANELMQFIFHQPFKEIDSAIVKVSEEIMATGKVERKLGEGYKEIGKTYTRIPGLYRLKENPLRFSGKTYLLTNYGTFSAGQGFASAYKCYGQGPIIGEETGGITVSFGDVHIFDLPFTGLKIMTSWDQAFSACGVDNQRGVMPDFEVINSIEDYMNKKDRVLEFTLNLIKDNK